MHTRLCYCTVLTTSRCYCRSAYSCQLRFLMNRRGVRKIACLRSSVSRSLSSEWGASKFSRRCASVSGCERRATAHHQMSSLCKLHNFCRWATLRTFSAMPGLHRLVRYAVRAMREGGVGVGGHSDERWQPVPCLGVGNRKTPSRRISDWSWERRSRRLTRREESIVVGHQWLQSACQSSRMAIGEQSLCAQRVTNYSQPVATDWNLELRHDVGLGAISAH